MILRVEQDHCFGPTHTTVGRHKYKLDAELVIETPPVACEGMRIEFPNNESVFIMDLYYSISRQDHVARVEALSAPANLYSQGELLREVTRLEEMGFKVTKLEIYP